MAGVWVNEVVNISQQHRCSVRRGMETDPITSWSSQITAALWVPLQSHPLREVFPSRQVWSRLQQRTANDKERC